MKTLLFGTLMLISLPAYGGRKIDWSIGKSLDLNQLHIAEIRKGSANQRAQGTRTPANVDGNKRRSENGVGFYQSFGGQGFGSVCATRSSIRNCY